MNEFKFRGSADRSMIIVAFVVVVNVVVVIIIVVVVAFAVVIVSEWLNAKKSPKVLVPQQLSLANVSAKMEQAATSSKWSSSRKNTERFLWVKGK